MAKGWTTLSLQQSGMFFLISLVLFVLTEYLIQTIQLSTQGPAYFVVRESTSALLTHRHRLNVESQVTPTREANCLSRAIVRGRIHHGAVIAAHLKRIRGFDEVVLLERGPRLMDRASFTNQARVHNGYHYPRSFTTAYRSVVKTPPLPR